MKTFGNNLEQLNAVLRNNIRKYEKLSKNNINIKWSSALLSFQIKERILPKHTITYYNSVYNIHIITVYVSF